MVDPVCYPEVVIEHLEVQVQQVPVNPDVGDRAPCKDINTMANGAGQDVGRSHPEAVVRGLGTDVEKT